MVSELSMGYSETQRARAFSMLQVVFGLGGIVGASLGGEKQKKIVVPCGECCDNIDNLKI